MGKWAQYVRNGWDEERIEEALQKWDHTLKEYPSMDEFQTVASVIAWEESGAQPKSDKKYGKTATMIGGVLSDKVAKKDLMTLTVKRNVQHLGMTLFSKVERKVQKGQSEAKGIAALKQYKKSKEADPGMSRTAGWAVTALEEIKRDNIDDENVYRQLADYLDAYANIELIKKTGHGLTALHAGSLAMRGLKGMVQDIQKNHAQLWADFSTNYHDAWQAGTLKESDKTPCPQDIEFEVIKLYAVSRDTHKRGVQTITELKPNLQKALDFESLKAWVRNPRNADAVDGLLLVSEKAVTEIGAGVRLAGKTPIPSGAVKESLVAGGALLDSLNLYAHRQIRAVIADYKVTKIMNDPKRMKETIASLNPLDAAKYLKGKYEADLKQIIANIKAAQAAIQSAISIALDAATHGASGPATALVNEILDAVVDVLTEAVYDFLMGLQEGRIRAAEKEWKKLKDEIAAKPPPPDLVKVVTRNAAAMAADAQGKVKIDKAGILKEADKNSAKKKSIGDTIERWFVKVGQHPEEVSDSISLKQLKLDMPGLAGVMVSAVLEGVIEEALKQVPIEPAQLFSAEDYESASLRLAKIGA